MCGIVSVTNVIDDGTVGPLGSNLTPKGWRLRSSVAMPTRLTLNKILGHQGLDKLLWC